MITSPKCHSRVELPAEDPSYSKIKHLHDRWQEIHHEIDREKQCRRDSIEDQLQMLEDRVAQKRQADEVRIAELRTHIDTVNEVVAGERANRRNYMSSKEKELKQIESQLTQSIETEKQNVDEKESSFSKEVDDRITTTMGEIEQMEVDNQRDMEASMSQARVKIAELEQVILQQRKRREQSTTQVTENIEADLNRLHNVLTVQKKVREQTQNKLFRMIEEVQRKLAEELNTERRQRQQMNEAMLQLLEETCHKVERHFR